MEGGTHTKSVKITLNIFAVYCTEIMAYMASAEVLIVPNQMSSRLYDPLLSQNSHTYIEKVC